MRNLELITMPAHASLAQIARHAFMEQTATWSVVVREMARRDALDTYLSADKFEYPVHAFALDAHFSGVAYRYSTQANATGELAQGCDCLSYLEGGAEATFLLPLSVVECFEEQFFPLEGARIAILGAGHLGLACAYECARCGVSEVLVVDQDAQVAERNLEAFLNEFGRLRSEVVDMRQAKPGHVSFQHAYEQTDYYFGTYCGAIKRISQADVIICATDQSLPVAFVSNLDFSHRPFIIECLHDSSDSNIVPLATIAQCPTLNGDVIWGRWGVLLAQFLTYSNKMI